jgi:hypothetical protein
VTITENKQVPDMHICILLVVVVVFFFLQTDTASVLQETIGYIRFLLSQIEVLLKNPIY